MIRLLARLIQRVAGWKVEGERPAGDRCVLVSAPHTSLWDGFLLVVMGLALSVPLSWMCKKEMFVGPFGPFLRLVRAVSVDRQDPRGLVDQLVETFAAQPQLVLAIPPEGTRSLQPHWKSGFRRIALGAQVPICLGYLDWPRRRGGFGPVFHPSDDVGRDMDRIREFYADKVGRRPELFGPIRLRSEVDAGEEEA